MVCIHCMTYNQSAYITDALNGFAMQKTDFPFVALVFDDASTDGEQEVIKKYLDEHFDYSEETGYKQWETDDANYTFARHKSNGKCFFLVALLKKNLYRNPRKGELIKVWDEKAKYIAMCEGDDYWTDPLKLQKQVDFLERHEDYSMCFTNCMVKYPNCEVTAINHIWDTYTIEDIIQSNALNAKERGDYVVSCGHTSTILYRNPIEALPSWISRCFIGDEPLFIALGQYGKAKFLNVPATVYRANVGVSSKNYTYERDWMNRIKMYEIINEGLHYRYKQIINPIIASFYFMLCKLLWKNGSKWQSLKCGMQSFLADRHIITQWLRQKPASRNEQ